MNCAAFLSISILLPAAFALDSDTNPLSKTIQLLDSLAAKVDKEGKADEKVFKEYSDWCGDTMSNLKLEIKGGERNKEELEATISKTTADIAAANNKIEDLVASLATDEQEFNEANAVRTKEATDFAASEAELLDGVSTLDRAVTILHRETGKNPAAFAQVDASNVNKLLKVMDTVIDAASFPVTDQKKLAALVQAQQGSQSDEFWGVGAPAYKTHSTNIFDTLEDLKEKAEGQLSDLRKAEATAKNNFEMLHGSLRDSIKADTSNQDASKAAKAASQEDMAIAEGDLAETNKGLDNDNSVLATTSRTCSQVTADYASNTKARDEELTALNIAKKVLSETTSGAGAHSYSFLQLAHQSQFGSKLRTRVDLANAELVSLLKRLAKENHSSSLAQLASRVASTVRYGAAAGQEPFTKVKQLITDMISKLEAQAQSDLTEKAYCDEEIAKSEAKKSELNAGLQKLITNMDQKGSKDARLKAAVKDLQAMLAEQARAQAEMDAIRQEGQNAYETAHADLSLGLEGVRKALKVLRTHYGQGAASASMLQDPTAPQLKMTRQDGHLLIHGKETEAGTKVIEALEVVESDFAKNLAVVQLAEDDAVADYQETTQANEHHKSEEEQDVKYKTKDYKSLDKSLSDLSGDKDTDNTELSAVLEYYGKLRERCIAKPESYATSKARREAEIAGLREALSILEGEAVFAQRGKKHGLHGAFLASS